MESSHGSIRVTLPGCGTFLRGGAGRPTRRWVALLPRLLKSTVWVHSNRGSSLATGSGSLIDRRRQLILTNYHVVGDVIARPSFSRRFAIAGPWRKNRSTTSGRAELGIRGRVVARDKRADLALIQIERVPSGGQALSLSPTPVAPGQAVHSIGNPGRSDWRCGSTHRAK